jgi:large subunit ribosomal protein L29
MKAQEIKELSLKEIIEKIETDKISLSRMKINHSISPLENPNKIKELKKDIARLKTELTIRECNQKAK